MIDTKYARVAKVVDGAVTGHGTLSSIYPSASWKREMTEEELNGMGFYLIESKEYGRFQESIATEPYFQVGSVFDNQVADKPLDEAKDEAISEIKALFAEYVAVGVTVGGVDIDTSPAAQMEVANLHADVQRRGGTRLFVTRSGAEVTADLDTTTAILDAVAAHVDRCRENEAMLRRQVAAATSIEDLEAIRMNDGWTDLEPIDV